MSVHERIATPEGKRLYVRTLFATIADRYDLITVVLSYGRDRWWKRRLVDLAAPGPGVRALDLATGTGDIAFAVGERAGRVVGLDVTRRMIEIAGLLTMSGFCRYKPKSSDSKKSWAKRASNRWRHSYSAITIAFRNRAKEATIREWQRWRKRRGSISRN